jgi:hypothetical protein
MIAAMRCLLLLALFVTPVFAQSDKEEDPDADKSRTLFPDWQR